VDFLFCATMCFRRDHACRALPVHIYSCQFPHLVFFAFKLRSSGILNVALDRRPSALPPCHAATTNSFRIRNSPPPLMRSLPSGHLTSRQQHKSSTTQLV